MGLLSLFNNQSHLWEMKWEAEVLHQFAEEKKKNTRALHKGWRNFFSAVLEKFLQPIKAPRVYGTIHK